MDISGFVDADRPEMLHSVLRSAANKPRVPKKKTVKMVKENKVYNTQMTEEDQSRLVWQSKLACSCENSSIKVCY